MFPKFFALYGSIFINGSNTEQEYCGYLKNHAKIFYNQDCKNIHFLLKRLSVIILAYKLQSHGY